MSIKILAIDIGGTSIKSALFLDRQFQTRFIQIPTHSDGTKEDISAAIRQCILNAGSFDRLVASLPGPCDYSTGRFLMTHKFAAAYGCAFKELSGGVDGVFLHDANAFLLGECAHGAGKGAVRCGGITLGTGLGAAVAINGEPMLSPSGAPADDVSLWNKRFRNGTAEDFVSTRRLLQDYAAPNVKAIAQAAQAGEASAQAAFKNYGQALYDLLQIYWTKFNLDSIVIGGQIASQLELLGNPPDNLPPIFSAQCGADAALYGGAAYLMAKIEHE